MRQDRSEESLKFFVLVQNPDHLCCIMSKEADDIVSGSEGSEGWDDVDEGGDEESLEIVSLLDDKVFPDARSMLEHCKSSFNFDFVAVRDRLGLDFYGSIKLVNFSSLASQAPPRFIS